MVVKIHIIIVYDIKSKQLTKVYKYLKTYLRWIQNSVFEGDVTKAEYKIITEEVKELIEPDIDSVIIFQVPEKYLKREIIGIEKNPIELIF